MTIAPRSRGSATRPPAARVGARAQAPRRRKDARPAEILAAARAEFLEHAFDGASVARIAARAGIVEGTVYRYYRSKRELFDAVLAEFYEALLADIEPRFASLEGTAERLRYLIARHLRIAVDDPAFTRLIVREARAHGVSVGSQMHALNRRYAAFLTTTLRDGVARGDLRAGLDLAMARDLVFGGLEHWVGNAIARGRAVDAEAAASTMVAMLLDGWAARGAPPEPLEGRLAAIDARLARIERRVGGRSTRP